MFCLEEKVEDTIKILMSSTLTNKKISPKKYNTSSNQKFIKTNRTNISELKAPGHKLSPKITVNMVRIRKRNGVQVGHTEGG
jgi:hypothetical protein